ncbi:hypothetical protein JN531_016645 (plasmid) [Flagellatimonas centrodinii]|uniref:hypothetical protein n=1 Tax=Flagellatimonas centrodinii TaxID=2806210 RepID=UPI001FFA3799|nr:hypothetical protein [Flagellatimonas centrodinii]ULQ48406.1 hypothetical protein JN531_016645 [Flagellatimonas centrodinii]
MAIDVHAVDANGGESTPYSANRALVFGELISRGQRITVVTEHPVDAEGLGVGVLLSESSVRQLLERLGYGDPGDTENLLLEPEILAMTPGLVSWLVPGAVRPMWFRLGSKDAHVTVCWPDLVFAVTARGTLAVAACSAAACKRTRNVNLYHAPLMNVYGDGRVCLPGGVELRASRAGRPSAEDAMFKTAFSHVNHTAVLPGNKPTTNANVLRFWRAQGKRPVQVKQLRPMGVCLADWLRGLS